MQNNEGQGALGLQRLNPKRSLYENRVIIKINENCPFVEKIGKKCNKVEKILYICSCV